MIDMARDTISTLLRVCMKQVKTQVEFKAIQICISLDREGW